MFWGHCYLERDLWPQKLCYKHISYIISGRITIFGVYIPLGPVLLCNVKRGAQ